MQMVAGAKLRRYETAWTAGRPYAEGLSGLLDRLLTDRPETSHPLLEARSVTGRLLLIVGSDTGLCGSYNVYLHRVVERFLAKAPTGWLPLDEEAAPRAPARSVRLAVVGRKALTYFRRRGIPIERHWTGLRGREGSAEVAPIAEYLAQAFVERRCDEVWVASTRYRSVVSYQPRVERWLPLRDSSLVTRASRTDEPRATSPGFEEERPWPGIDYLIEPSAQEVIEAILMPYLVSRLYMTVLEAFVAEQAARMMAMQSATTNADEVVEHLTLLRNKIRQASITKEILEVVGGAEALK